MSRWSLRPLTIATAATSAMVLVGLGAAPASAHVTVNPREATQGGFAAFAFRVPNERSDAGTVKLDVAFPADQPIAHVSVRPHPGWSYQVKRTKLAQPIEAEGGDISEVVSTLTWTADSPATAIRAGEYDEFSISAGPLPENAETLVFKANQTYTDGAVVRWIEQAPAGSTEEPEHPAPSVALLPATADAEPAGQPAAPAGRAPESAAEASSGPSTGLVYTALGFGLLGVALGAAGVVLASRRRAVSAADGSPQPDQPRPDSSSGIGATRR